MLRFVPLFVFWWPDRVSDKYQCPPAVKALRQMYQLGILRHIFKIRAINMVEAENRVIYLLCLMQILAIFYSVLQLQLHLIKIASTFLL